MDEYLKAIKSITSEDIKEISRKIFDFTKIGIFSYGDYKNVDNIEKNMKEMVESYNALQT